MTGEASAKWARAGAWSYAPLLVTTVGMLVSGTSETSDCGWALSWVACLILNTVLYGMAARALGAERRTKNEGAS